MEATSIQSITPLISAADEWHEVLLLLPVLVGLEVVLSADNAIALAAIARGLNSPEEQKRALNLGLIFALVFRIILILAARWVLGFRPLMAAGAAYLLWLCGSHFLKGAESPEDASNASGEEAAEQAKAKAKRSLLLTAGSIALTDLAFSLDSVAAAVAVSDRLGLVISGGVIGVIALRLTSGLFIRLLQVYELLESAGYLAVGLVGLQLLVRVIWPSIELPEWALLMAVGLLFVGGFSRKVAKPEEVNP
ncbi:MAG: TerC family protein [Synechococcus lacustris]|jgi:YkoY family integral membrane protein